MNTVFRDHPPTRKALQDTLKGSFNFPPVHQRPSPPPQCSQLTLSFLHVFPSRETKNKKNTKS
ncbi:hypothetical protein E2C01_021459 [Portunus trituberculatus]|uniref:Uncharacterized protein n=1 Tax=Portunus trituberculatus TaxID=210409 RepID=A0A5B7E2R8_PORTR|nr:hypothetical protein [Portunus trituberculatus]